jgi:YVTN family beta-propeller protein
MKATIPSFVFYSAAFLILMIMISSSAVVLFSFLGNRLFNIAQAHSATIPVGIFPYGIKYDPTNDSIYVANAASSTVSVISGSTNSVIATTLVGWGPVWLAHVPSNNQIYVTNSHSNDVYVINGLTNEVIEAIAVGRIPLGIAYDPTNNSVYVANSEDNTVSVINAATDNVVSTIPLFSGRGVGLPPIFLLIALLVMLYICLGILLALFQ